MKEVPEKTDQGRAVDKPDRVQFLLGDNPFVIDLNPKKEERPDQE